MWPEEFQVNGLYASDLFCYRWFNEDLKKYRYYY